MRVFVARRPILDPTCAVVGYELLFRSAPDAEPADATDRDHASSVGSRLAARSALVEEVVHAVRRRSQIGESEKNVPTHLCARTSGT